jgi:hypothetical protein
VGAGDNTFPAADTQIAVVIHNFTGTVVAHLGGAHRDTAVAVHALVFQYFDNRPKGRTAFHGIILCKNSINYTSERSKVSK